MPTDIGARVRAKFPIDEALVEAWKGELPCPQCKRMCSIIAGFRVRIGALAACFNLAELGALDLHRTAWHMLGPVAKAHGIGWQQSEARRGEVLCNACPHCRAAIGAELHIGEGAYRVMLGARMQPLGLWRWALFEPGNERKRAAARLLPVGPDFPCPRDFPRSQEQ
jgi:hypothetical protein